MRVIFCGSGTFGVPTLAAVRAAGHDVVRVYTQPSRPAGRGGGLRATPAGESAAGLGLDVHECANVNAPEVVEAIRALAADVIVVVDFGQIIRASVRGAAAHGAVNLHGSLLPALRGAAPVNWAMIQGLDVTGVTTFSLVDAVDAGDVYLRAPTAIDPRETAEELKGRLAAIGADVMVQTLAELASGRAQAVPQDHTLATPAPRLTKADGVIDWAASAVTIRHRVHGTWRWPGGQAVFVGARHTTAVTFARVEAVQRDAGILPASGGGGFVPSDSQANGMHNAGELAATKRSEDGTPASREAPRPGTVLSDGTVATGEGCLRVLEIQPAGKRLMSWQDFVNGYRVAAGDGFHTPPETPGTP